MYVCKGREDQTFCNPIQTGLTSKIIGSVIRRMAIEHHTMSNATTKRIFTVSDIRSHKFDEGYSCQTVYSYSDQSLAETLT